MKMPMLKATKMNRMLSVGGGPVCSAAAMLIKAGSVPGGVSSARSCQIQMHDFCEIFIACLCNAEVPT